MGAQVFLALPPEFNLARISSNPSHRHGKGNEGNEGHEEDGSHEGDEGNEEEVRAGSAEATALKKSECSKVMDALVEIATSEVNKGKFTIPGLVMLKKKTKPARAAGTRLMFGKTVKVKAQKAKTI